MEKVTIIIMKYKATSKGKYAHKIANTKPSMSIINLI